MAQGVLILGTRTLAIDVMDMIGEIPGYEVAGFVENLDRQICDRPLEGHRVYWIDEVPKLAATHIAICALSTTQRRSYVEQVRAMGMRFATLVHPTARVSRRATLGEGCFVSAMAAIATDTVLGRNVYVNRGALIGHHTRIGDYCTIQPGANIAGANVIGQQTYVGMGAVVLDKLVIGEGSVIAAGAMVAADVPERVCVMGAPAMIAKKGIEPK